MLLKTLVLGPNFTCFFCKQNFIETQPYLLVYVWPMSAFALEPQN